jgi:hypothetical protein
MALSRGVERSRKGKCAGNHFECHYQLVLGVNSLFGAKLVKKLGKSKVFRIKLVLLYRL